MVSALVYLREVSSDVSCFHGVSSGPSPRRLLTSRLPSPLSPGRGGGVAASPGRSPESRLAHGGPDVRRRRRADPEAEQLLSRPLSADSAAELPPVGSCSPAAAASQPSPAAEQPPSAAAPPAAEAGDSDPHVSPLVVQSLTSSTAVSTVSTAASTAPTSASSSAGNRAAPDTASSTAGRRRGDPGLRCANVECQYSTAAMTTADRGSVCLCGAPMARAEPPPPPALPSPDGTGDLMAPQSRPVR